MGLLDDMQPEVRRKPCRVRTILEQLDPSDQKILTDALASKKWSSAALADNLTKRDLQVSYGTMKHHREGQCTCSRT